MNSERYLSWADAFLVVYSIDNRDSFSGCQPYLQTLNLHNKTCRPQTPIILLGNKLDMERYRRGSLFRSTSHNMHSVVVLYTLNLHIK